MKQQAGAVIDHHQLQHQRRSPHDGDINAHEPAQRRAFAHAAQRHRQAQGQRPQKRQGKDGGGDAKGLQQLQQHGENAHVPIPRFD